MRFESETRERSVELSVERDERSRDLHVGVEVRTPAFSARTSTWIDRDAWEAFVLALESLERSRAGAARVASLSPGELELSVRALDRAGHVGVEGLVGKCAPEPWQVRFSAFAIDPSALPELVRVARRA